MINMDKKYRTRDFREVRIYAVDGSSRQPIHGSIKLDSGWTATVWNLAGKECDLLHNPNLDLIEVKPRYKLSMWVNVYPDNELYTRRAADHAAGPNRIACIKVELDFEEGEGL